MRLNMKIAQKIRCCHHLFCSSHCMFATSFDEAIKQCSIGLDQLVGNLATHPLNAVCFLCCLHTFNDSGSQTFHKDATEEFSLSSTASLIVYERDRHAQW